MRLGAVVVMLAAIGCSDRYGAYLEVTSDVAFARLEFFFAGPFPDRSCNGDVTHDLLPLERTPAWSDANTASTGSGAPEYEVLRRQFNASDLNPPAELRTTATYQLPTAIDETELGYTAGLGKMVVVVAYGPPDPITQQEPIVAIGQRYGFEVPDGEVHLYQIKLHAPTANDDIELWRAPLDTADTPACLRWTETRPDARPSSLFIVREWDRDCDGLITRNCPYGDQEVVVEDCNPQQYCDPTTNVGCGSEFGCLVPIDIFPGGEAVCRPGVCVNRDGAKHQTCLVASTGMCFGPAVCGVDQLQCDRPDVECGILDGEPDLACKIPVYDGKDGNEQHARGVACISGLIKIPLSNDGQPGCPMTSRIFASRAGELLEYFFGFSALPTNGFCDLKLTPEQVLVPSIFRGARVVVVATSAVNATNLDTGVIALEPEYGDCSSPMPACTSLPDARLHSCPQ